MRDPQLQLEKCIFADDHTCKAFELRGTKGALDSYCTPTQLRLFHTKKVVPPRGPCLLCCRDLVNASVVASQNVVHPEKQSCRRFIATTYPSCDVPGGYKSQYVLHPSQSVVLATPFVKSAMSKLSVRISQTPDLFSGAYVDQNDLVYTGSMGLN